MSYSRRHHEKIAIHYSGTVSYPASKSGGLKYYSGTTYEDIYVNIDVDTIPFDRSVNDCNSNVNLLTGAVVATEAAQIAAIDSNAKKVAGTIIEGFFKNIRFEISAQIMELRQKIDAHLMHLNELSKQLAAKKAQMETDYNRTSGRYNKIFEDLNNELSNRISALNKPAFAFKQLADKHSQRTTDNDLVSAVAVTGVEGGHLQACISASITKKRAWDAINQANVFLTKQKRLQKIINQSMLNENGNSGRFSPVCLLETGGEKNQIERSIYQASGLPEMRVNEIADLLQTDQWVDIPKENMDKITQYLNAEVSNAYPTTDPHTNRVKDTIAKILNLNSIKSVQLKS
ncbi:MAG: hypothetical protein LBF67_08245 [Prevotellaceae bacterium]|jgi:hypothetical protein|nr:hypothetical protein [Prevotellaceae bacterium]